MTQELKNSCAICNGKRQLLCQLCDGIGCFSCHLGYYECPKCGFSKPKEVCDNCKSTIEDK